jgi:hypothetical protein
MRASSVKRRNAVDMRRGFCGGFRIPLGCPVLADVAIEPAALTGRRRTGRAIELRLLAASRPDGAVASSAFWERVLEHVGRSIGGILNTTATLGLGNLKSTA